MEPSRDVKSVDANAGRLAGLAPNGRPIAWFHVGNFPSGEEAISASARAEHNRQLRAVVR